MSSGGESDEDAGCASVSSDEDNVKDPVSQLLSKAKTRMHCRLMSPSAHPFLGQSGAGSASGLGSEPEYSIPVMSKAEPGVLQMCMMTE